MNSKKTEQKKCFVELEPENIPGVLEFMNKDNRPSIKNAVNTLVIYGLEHLRQAQKRQGKIT